VNKPRITVLMPVFNGEQYLQEAIASILDQSYRQFELLIINDGSTDNSVNIIDNFSDQRIRVITNPVNKGLIFSLNSGLESATAEFIARMDCDDICRPRRLEKQLLYLDHHPEIGVCGTWLRRFGDVQQKLYKPHTNPAKVKASLLFGCGVMHPTTMIRRSLLMAHNIRYDPAHVHAEDWYFWQACSKFEGITNLPEVLLDYRVRNDGITRQADLDKLKRDEIYKLIYKKVLDDFGISPSAQDLEIHRLICSSEPINDITLLSECHRWLILIQSKNKENHYYDQQALDYILANQFLFVCKKSSVLGFKAWQFLWNNKFFDKNLLDKRGLAKFFIRCYLKR
jgi:glycosyltransferase involved in cell wall biosynthesis